MLTYIWIGIYRIFFGTGEIEDDEEPGGNNLTYLRVLGGRGVTDGGHDYDYAPGFLRETRTHVQDTA
jgi:hypothetical protein